MVHPLVELSKVSHGLEGIEFGIRTGRYWQRCLDGLTFYKLS